MGKHQNDINEYTSQPREHIKLHNENHQIEHVEKSSQNQRQGNTTLEQCEVRQEH